MKKAINIILFFTLFSIAPMVAMEQEHMHDTKDEIVEGELQINQELKRIFTEEESKDIESIKNNTQRIKDLLKIAYKQNKLDEVTDYITKEMQHQSAIHKSLYYALGVAAFYKMDGDSAYEAFTRAAELGHIEALVCKALVLEHDIGLHHIAYSTHDLESYINNPAALMSELACYLLGDCYRKKNKLVEAATYFKKAADKETVDENVAACCYEYAKLCKDILPHNDLVTYYQKALTNNQTKLYFQEEVRAQLIQLYNEMGWVDKATQLEKENQ